jgi:hypothetical protein
MRRLMLLVTVALMVALSGTALADPTAARGGGGHFEETDFPGITLAGGRGGSAKGSGGGHLSGGVIPLASPLK